MFLLPITPINWKACGGLFWLIKPFKKNIRTSVLLSLKEKQEEEMLTALPPPVPSQIEAIGVAIEKVVQEFGLNNEDLEERLNIKTVMENLLRQKMPGITCNSF